MNLGETEKKTLTGSLTDRGGPLVTWSVEYPALSGPAGRYFDRAARSCGAQARRLLPAAHRLRQRTGAPGPFCRLEGTGALTYDRGGLLSVAWDQLWDAGLLGRRRSRCSGILEKSTGRPIPVAALFRGPIPTDRMLAAILPQAETLAADGCTLYSGWRQLCRRQFSPERCYLTDDGLALWYPWQVLGPDCAGIPTFLVPYRALRHRLAREL